MITKLLRILAGNAAIQESIIDLPPVEKKQEIPDDLICSICKDLFTDAVMIPCCGSSFCDECKHNQWIPFRMQEFISKIHLNFQVYELHCSNLRIMNVQIAMKRDHHPALSFQIAFYGIRWIHLKMKLVTISHDRQKVSTKTTNIYSKL